MIIYSMVVLGVIDLFVFVFIVFVLEDLEYRDLSNSDELVNNSNMFLKIFILCNVELR